jgi:hypothetical protein
MVLKAIVLDMDGTLLNSEKIISPKTRAKLIEAQEKGIKLVLASGRPIQGLLEFAEELEMDKYEGFLVAYNGSLAYDVKTKEILHDQSFSMEFANKMLDHLTQFDIVTMVDQDDYKYVNEAFFNYRGDVPKEFLNVVHYERNVGHFKICEVDDYSKIIDRPVNKILTLGRPAYLQENYKNLTEPFKEHVTNIFSTPYYLEFNPKGVEKGHTLEVFLSDLDIYPENVIAFGDGQNDRSIIEYAGVGVAMGNAAQEILDLADEVTLTNDEDGIVEVLNRYF